MRPILCLLAGLALAVSGEKKDPEETMTTPQMIQYWGYPAEIISVTTDDGYILTMHRIPHGKAGPGEGDPCRPIIFMQHGLECDSSNFVINTPEESAGFIFADAGFDVWLGNMRGNTYSKAHTSLNPKHKQFWEFSWDEMAQHDLPAMINKVLDYTGQDSLYYMGHSQGTLTMFAKLSSDPEFASKIKSFFALAPVGTVKYIKGLLAWLAEYLLPEMDLWYDIFGDGEFLPNSWFMDMIARVVCGNFVGDMLCDDVLFLIAGPETAQFNTSRTEVYIAHTPAGTSNQNIMHWTQMVKAGTVARYDYGSSKENQQHYGSSSPPSYDFAPIKTDMYLYWSDDDWLADSQDIQSYLLTTLDPNYIKGNNHLNGYNHLDFIWGLNAPGEIYNPIVELLKKQMGGKVQCVASNATIVRAEEKRARERKLYESLEHIPEYYH